MDEICYYILGHFRSLDKMNQSEIILEKTIENILSECKGELLALNQDRNLIIKNLLLIQNNNKTLLSEHNNSLKNELLSIQLLENEKSYCRGYIDTFSIIYQSNGIWKIQIPNDINSFEHFNKLNGIIFFKII